jgi:hypothetical protein
VFSCLVTHVDKLLDCSRGQVLVEWTGEDSQCRRNRAHMQLSSGHVVAASIVYCHGIKNNSLWLRGDYLGIVVSGQGGRW